MKTNDLVGQRFGRLTVISQQAPHYSKGGHKIATWLCKCDCGKEKVFLQGNLVHGNAKSCGCLKAEHNKNVWTKHGKANTRLYNTYSHMKSRCYRENDTAYPNYGGRGIEVCDEWLNDFSLFEEWALANGYEDDLTIERIDVNGNYCPQNCTWIPFSQQQRNRRNTHFITYQNETLSLSEWEKKVGMSRSRIRHYEKKFNSGAKAIEYAILKERNK